MNKEREIRLFYAARSFIFSLVLTVRSPLFTPPQNKNKKEKE